MKGGCLVNLLKNVKIVLPDKILQGSLLFSNRIEKIISDQNNDPLNRLKDKYNEIQLIDGQGYYLSPGFIDIHIHGAAGFDIMDGTGEALTYIKESLIKSGVTSFLATTMSMSLTDISKALKAIRREMGNEVIGTKGARILGCHLEGPFLNKEYKGAQAEENIISPDIELVKEFRDVIKTVTIAPEVKGAGEFIRFLTKNNIISSAGHTAANYDDIIKAQEWGLVHSTHLFNAMTKLHHREPGLIGAALTTDMSCEMIADFIHIHPAVLNLVLQAKESNKIILVTDQMRAGALDDGDYDLGGQRVIVKDGSARLENGSLAGSVLRMDQAVRNIRKISDLEINEIINMVTYNPAKLLGMDKEIGLIREGNNADFTLLNADFEVKAVYKDGQRQFI